MAIKEDCHLEIEVWDWDRLKSNDFSGAARLDLKPMLKLSKTSKPAEKFTWVDLHWKNGSTVLGGRQADQVSQVQIRVRVIKNRDADDIVEERARGNDRARHGAPEERLYGLNMTGTRRGIVLADAKSVHDPQLKMAIEESDKKEILRLIQEDKTITPGDIKIARQQLRVISSQEAKVALRTKAAETTLMQGMEIEGDMLGSHVGGEDSGSDHEMVEVAANAVSSRLVELAGQFAKGELSKNEYLKAKAEVERSAPVKIEKYDFVKVCLICDVS